MKFLVTAGPTHEHLDPVRFLANASSGKMGYAIAREARRRGHTVSLISGPTHLRPPRGIRLTKVISAMSMRQAIKKEIRRSHCLIMAAAVADYRPAKSSSAKIRKGKGPRSLALVPNPDILGEIGRSRWPGVLVGFSLETETGEARARNKLRQKRLDFIVQNAPATIGSDSITATILFSDGRRKILKQVSKAVAARRIVRLAEDARKERQQTR